MDEVELEFATETDYDFHVTYCHVVSVNGKRKACGGYCDITDDDNGMWLALFHALETVIDILEREDR